MIDDLACAYCGDPATGWDHFIPTAFLLKTQDVAESLRDLTTPLLPCCIDCNRIANDGVFPTASAKKQHIAESLRRRHGRVLRTPDWTPDELAELGYDLRTHVIAGLARRDALRDRLAHLEGRTTSRTNPGAPPVPARFKTVSTVSLR